MFAAHPNGWPTTTTSHHRPITFILIKLTFFSKPKLFPATTTGLLGGNKKAFSPPPLFNGEGRGRKGREWLGRMVGRKEVYVVNKRGIR